MTDAWGLWCLQVLDRSQILEHVYFRFVFVLGKVRYNSVAARFFPMVRKGTKLSFQPSNPISFVAEICIQEMHMDGPLPWSSCIHHGPRFCIWISTCWTCHVFFAPYCRLGPFPLCRSGWNHIEVSVSAAAIAKRLISIECRTAVGGNVVSGCNRQTLLVSIQRKH